MSRTTIAAVTGRQSARRSAERDPRCLARPEDANVDARGQDGGMHREPFARFEKGSLPDPVEAARVQRSPVDGHREGRSDLTEDSGGRTRSEMAGSEVRAPRPDGEHREVDVTSQASHLLEAGRVTANQTLSPLSMMNPSG
jgi:hypothetical protein